jgi:hypothetical protein
MDEQLDIEECIRMMTQNDTAWFTRRKRAWDEHRRICNGQGVTPLQWESFKRVVMRLDTFPDMVMAGVQQAKKASAVATIIPFVTS